MQDFFHKISETQWEKTQNYWPCFIYFSPFYKTECCTDYKPF